MNENEHKDLEENFANTCVTPPSITAIVFDVINTVVNNESKPSTSGKTSSKITINDPLTHAPVREAMNSTISPKRVSSAFEIFKATDPTTDSDSETDVGVAQDVANVTYHQTPPSYSAVMRMGPVALDERKKLFEIDSKSSTPFASRIPPPSYAEVEGIWTELPRHESSEEILFGPDPVYMVCPHCSAIVITETYAQRSAATHFTAIALCLFGCWPCCLLPYFMNSCKNTYHHCPVCNYFFGVYRPW